MIRAAGPADVAALAGVESACFGHDAWSGSLVESELTGGTRSVLLAAERDTVVGYGSIQVIDGVADLRRIAVVPEARRGGLGRQLLEELLARATALGATRMLLEVAAVNEAAFGLYAGFGFTEISRRKRYYADGSDAIVMQKGLR